MEMRWEQIEGDWKSFKTQMMSQWSKLNDDQLNLIAGKREKLAAKIQELYVISKEEAERQIKTFEEQAKAPQSAKAATV
jgi:uncharacterized protein YjbJ (UPF0337 family)